jgi:hypothetical protein
LVSPRPPASSEMIRQITAQRNTRHLLKKY